jgi:hypothetical protein
MMIKERFFCAKELTRLWHSSMTNERICQQLGCSNSQLYILARRLKLPARGHVKVEDGERGPGDPDEETIRHRAAKIMASWSPEVAERRRVGKSPKPMMKNYAFDGRHTTFAECGLP